ncbi:MAG: hypothetical protein HY238_27680 [Acidobacteria bacterium]|nr:hypothetical protein [Acidobacteriota bacterium]
MGSARKRGTLRLSKARLDALVEEATVDAYNESEQATGLYTMIEDNLRLPFETEILGIAITVESVDMAGEEEIVAVCKRGRKRQTISLLDLPLPSPPPAGAEWIEAYRYWRRGFQ